MKVSMRRFLWTALLGLVLLIAVPAVSLAQGRGRGRGADMSKKCGKFVNCHDARDGRVDGRGPSQEALRRSIFVRRNHNRRWTNADRNRFVRVRRFQRIRDNREERFGRRRLARVRWHRQ